MIAGAKNWLRGLMRPGRTGMSALRGRTDALANRAIEPADGHVFVRAANSWRDGFNPIRGLTMQRAVSLMEQGDRGAYADLQWLYQRVEQLDAVLSALIARYEGGLLKLDWAVKMIETAEERDRAAAEAQAEVLRETYEGIDNLRQALQFLIGARFRGYAHLEKWVNADGDIKHLEPVPQWYWCRAGQNGEWRFNRDAKSGVTGGEAVDLTRFLVREEARPINKVALVAFLRKNLSQKDWDGYIETFGLPAIFIVGPPGISPENEGKYQDLAEGIISDARGYLPNGAKVETVEAGKGGPNPFKEHIYYQDASLVLAGTGGKLTMLNEPTGIGGSQGNAHENAWREIVGAEALLLSEAMQRGIDKVVLGERFPEQRVLAYFTLTGAEDKETLAFKRSAWEKFALDGTVSDVLANLTDLKSLGKDVGLPGNEEYVDQYLPVRTEDGQLVTGGTVKDEAGDIVGGSVAGAARTDGMMNRGIGNRKLEIGEGEGTAPAGDLQGVYRAIAADMQPVRKRLEAIMRIEDAEIFAVRLREFRDGLPGLLKDINADPRSAAAIEGMLGEAMMRGAGRDRKLEIGK